MKHQRINQNNSRRAKLPEVIGLAIFSLIFVFCGGIGGGGGLVSVISPGNVGGGGGIGGGGGGGGGTPPEPPSKCHATCSRGFASPSPGACISWNANAGANNCGVYISQSLVDGTHECIMSVIGGNPATEAGRCLLNGAGAPPVDNTEPTPTVSPASAGTLYRFEPINVTVDEDLWSADTIIGQIINGGTLQASVDPNPAVTQYTTPLRSMVIKPTGAGWPTGAGTMTLTLRDKYNNTYGGALSSLSYTVLNLMGGADQTPLDTASIANAQLVAGTPGAIADLNNPSGIVSDENGMYVADTGHNRIVFIDWAGAITHIAGSLAYASGSADGNGSAATFNAPEGVTITNDGTMLYVADTGNNTIRSISLTPPYAVTTLAGTAGIPDCSGGNGSAARFIAPTGVTTDGNILYISDANCHTITTMTLGAPYTVTRYAGQFYLAGTANNSVATGARFKAPRQMVTDGDYLYIADTNNHAIRRIDIKNSPYPTTTLVGSTAVNDPGYTDAVGNAARFNYPRGISLDRNNLYVADTFNHTIRRVSLADLSVTTFAGTGSPGTTAGAGNIPRFGVEFNQPRAIGLNGNPNIGVGNGLLLVCDTANHIVRKIH